MKIIEGGITTAKSFKASALNSGVKKSGSDLALIYSEVPAIACGMFTQNRVQAAPVKVSRLHLKKITSQAIIVNSGNANCCTGKHGEDAALAMTEIAANKLGLEKEDILVASTGIIGIPLPIEKIKKSIPALVKNLSKAGGHSVAKAIMTTDKTVKELSCEIKIGKQSIRLGGIAKGAGMICPNMATMLCFITTDVHITRRALKLALKRAVGKSFNSISIDGETSTNDMVLVMANSAAGGDLIDRHKEDFEKFCHALEYLTSELAKKIVKDGEGATKFVEIMIKNAASNSGARRIAKKLANSILLKTALFGEDPNWGRIASAAGASGVKFNPHKLDIYIDQKRVLKDGTAVKVDKKELIDHFKKKNINITIDLKRGNRVYKVWTTDLSLDYIKLNAHYTT